MDALTTLVQSLGIAYASGISPYATVALAGIINKETLRVRQVVGLILVLVALALITLG